MPSPFFADLVRETSSAVGSGAFALSGAVPGHRRFADVVPAGASFFYAIAHVTVPNEWEAGVGSLASDGRLQRDAVRASSADGDRVNFSPGLKTAALTVSAEWFTECANDLDGLATAVAGKQPLSTAHEPTSSTEAGDTVTIRRASGWFNLPLASFVRRVLSGRFVADAPIDLVAGSASDVSVAPGGDAGLGLFRPAPGALGFAAAGIERLRLDASGLASLTGRAVLRADGAGMTTPLTLCNDSMAAIQTVRIGFDSNGSVKASIRAAVHGDNYLAFHVGSDTEQMRITAGGHVGVGTAAPAYRMHVVDASPDVLAAFRDIDVSTAGAAGLYFDMGARNGSTQVAAARLLAVLNGDAANGSLEFHTRIAGALAARLTINSAGHIIPGADNAQNLGSAARRVKELFSANGAINTSDAREKRWRGRLNEAELRAARRIAREIGVYRWNEAIAQKGIDHARLHFGVRAQAVWAIMADEGLVDPIGDTGRPGATPYGFLCWDAWDASDERPAGHIFGVRSDQLALFVAAAQAEQLAVLEARLEQAA